MAIELPWFKFYADEWLTGHITLEDEVLQGVFITVCAYYWKLDGDLSLDTLKRRYRHIQDDIWNQLINKNYLKMSSENNIFISFLDEQMKTRKKQSLVNKLNGSKGGQAKAKAKRTLSEKLPKAERKPSNIEGEEEKEGDIDENKKEIILSPFDKALKDFSDMRKGIKKPLNKSMRELILKKLTGFSLIESEQIEILEYSTMGSYQGIFPLKAKPNQKKTAQQISDEVDREIEELKKCQKN